MKKVGKIGLVLASTLGLFLLLSNQAVSWNIADPEIRDLCFVITVADYEGREEFSLYFTYLNDRSMNYIYKDLKAIEGLKKEVIKGRNCLLLAVFVKQDAYFHPTSIAFVQGYSQYDIGYNDIMPHDDAFSGGKLRSGVRTAGLLFIPEGIDVYSPMKIYYDDVWTTFSVPKEEMKEFDVEERIKRLESERVELKNKIIETEKRISEIDRELQELRKEGRVKEKKPGVSPRTQGQK